MLNYDHDSSVVTVPYFSGRTMHVVFEDVCFAFCNNKVAVIITETNDQLDEVYDEVIADDLLFDGADTIELDDKLQTRIFDHGGEPISVNVASNLDDEHLNADPGKPSPLFENCIEIYWPLDAQYYPGAVTAEAKSGQQTSACNNGGI